MELPFEKDSLELLAACALALRPLPAHSAAKEVPSSVQAQALPLAGTVWQRFPGGTAVLKQSGSSFAADDGTVLPDHLPDHLPERSAGISVEALSRAVERDARRYEAY